MIASCVSVLVGVAGGLGDPALAEDGAGGAPLSPRWRASWADAGPSWPLTGARRAEASSGTPHTLLLQVGSRSLSNDDLDEALDDQIGYGIEFASATPSGFGLEVAAFYSSDDASATAGSLSAEIDVSLLEFMLGARYTRGIGDSGFNLYAGAGVDLAYSSLEAELSDGVTTVEADETDTSVGGYVHGGAYFLFGKVGIGVDVRQTLGTKDSNLDDADVDDELEYFQVAGSIVVAL